VTRFNVDHATVNELVDRFARFVPSKTRRYLRMQSQAGDAGMCLTMLDGRIFVPV
jgi:hypothetical protein